MTGVWGAATVAAVAWLGASWYLIYEVTRWRMRRLDRTTAAHHAERRGQLVLALAIGGAVTVGAVGYFGGGGWSALLPVAGTTVGSLLGWRQATRGLA